MDEQNIAVQDNTNTATETEQTTTATTEQTEQTTSEQTTETQQEQQVEQAGQVAEQEQTDAFADYKPELPNGVNQEMLELALPVFKELGLNPEQADKILPIADKLVQDTVGKVVADINEQCQKNYEDVFAEIKADKQIGGRDFDKNMGQVNALLKKYGDDSTPEQFHSALTALAGFDKEAVKPFFNAIFKMAQDAADDTVIMGSSKTQEASFYPGLPKGARFK